MLYFPILQFRKNTSYILIQYNSGEIHYIFSSIQFRKNTCYILPFYNSGKTPHYCIIFIIKKYSISCLFSNGENDELSIFMFPKKSSINMFLSYLLFCFKFSVSFHFVLISCIFLYFIISIIFNLDLQH